MKINARTQDADKKLHELQELYLNNQITDQDLEKEVKDLLKQGDISIERDIANPVRSPFDANSKKKWKLKTDTTSQDKAEKDNLSREITQSSQQGDWEQVEVYVQTAIKKGFLTQDEHDSISKLENQKYVEALRNLISSSRKPSTNLFAGKGQSYADRVEGPDGWGKHVKPIHGSEPDFSDPNWADDLWNSDGRW
ncbi:hypothetical protein vBDshPR2C_20 [Dinoroseobacter phage vBDshPR2C]|uniref:Uncharacterized protein n=1 Tax=Dinoroseobacter phage vBDshPR2C TaxID=1498169 RepID=A0A0A7CHN3_9CAUD|nr:hypothetical protein vBDshPR2C_20 [Dinoroseobacter phage vBDshPR2C]